MDALEAEYRPWDYVVVYGNDQRQLRERVLLKQGEGYCLSGGVSEWEGGLVQAMYREEYRGK